MIFNTVANVQSYAKKQELRLAEAVATNDVVAVKKLLRQGVNPNPLLSLSEISY